MKRVIPKVVTMVCIVSMILGLYQPVSVKAYVYQNSKISTIYIGDTYIIKMGKLIQTSVSGNKGTATYDAENNILTLDNLELNGNIGICYLDGITIIIKGTVKICNSSGSAFVIEQDGNATMLGSQDANLIIDAGNEQKNGAGIRCSGQEFKLQNLKMNINSAVGGCIGAINLNIDNCNIKAKSYINEYMSDQNLQYILNNNIYAAVGAEKINIKNSTIDAEGVRCGIAFDQSVNMDSDARVTDADGVQLYPIHVHLRDEIDLNLYSKQQLSTTYEGYGIAERHVIIKNYHNLTKHEAVAPTCTHGGNIEYYSCASCGTYYSDSAANNTITYESALLPVNPSNHTPKAAVKENIVNATKSKTGSYDEVVYCAECNAEISRVKKTIPKLGSEDSNNASNSNDSSNNGDSGSSNNNNDSSGNNGDSSSGNNNNQSGTDAGTSSDSTTVSDSTKRDAKTTSFRKLMARVTGNTKTSLKLRWNKVKGADGYLIYAKKCASKGSYKKIKTIKKKGTTSYTQKKLKKGTYYQYKVVAYKTKGNKKYILSTSMPVYATTKGGKYTNPKSVRITKPDRAKKKSEVIIKKGKKVQLKANIKKGKQAVKEYRKLSYETSNKKIATVSAKGVIKGVRKGTCYVYIYAQNGVYRKVKVTIS